MYDTSIAFRLGYKRSNIDNYGRKGVAIHTKADACLLDIIKDQCNFFPSESDLIL